MRHQQLAVDPRTGVPQATTARLVRSFLSRHGQGLDDILRRFPSVSGPALRAAIESSLEPRETARELQIKLDEASDTLLSLCAEKFHPLPVDAGQRVNLDAGLRWYAARFRDLAQAARYM